MKIYEKLASLLTLLMEESWNPGAHPEKKNRRRNVQAVKDYLDQHYAEKISLDNLAEQFYINKFYLTRIFREQFGLSVSAYLQQVRITHAKQLLRFTDQSIEKIGQECGMNDANYFSRIFRKTEGVSPGRIQKAVVRAHLMTRSLSTALLFLSGSVFCGYASSLAFTTATT